MSISQPNCSFFFQFSGLPHLRLRSVIISVYNTQLPLAERTAWQGITVGELHSAAADTIAETAIATVSVTVGDSDRVAVSDAVADPVPDPDTATDSVAVSVSAPDTDPVTVTAAVTATGSSPDAFDPPGGGR